MTVQPQDTYQYYSGPITAGTTLSITDFAFASNSHVSVKVRGEADNWLYGTDYLVEGENTAERSLTIKKDVAEGAVLAVYLDVPITQKVSPEEGGNFPAVTQEFTLDKLTYICQMLDARLSRAFQVSIDTNFNGTLFDPTNKAGKAIKINSTGTGLEYSVEDIDTISATMRELFNQVTALHDETGTWKDLAKDWATKTSGEVVEGQGYGAKKYADDAKQSVEGFDANVAEKTNAFNTNATEKTGAFDTNAIDKTNSFDTNAIDKTNDFNTNAIEPTPLVNNLAKAAAASATAAATSEANALASEAIAEAYSDHSQIWAEGNDDQVGLLGGEHSAKEWARQASQGVPDATQTIKGKIKIASQAEADLGKDDSAAMTALKVASQAGKVQQLGFNGTLTGKILTFTTNTEYILLPNIEYEIDLLFSTAGELDSDTTLKIMNGDTELKLINSLDKDITTGMTVASMSQVMHYNAETGFRWLFKAVYKIASNNEKVLLLYPVVANTGSLYTKVLTYTTTTSLELAMPGLRATDKVFIALSPAETYTLQKENQKEFAKLYKAIIANDKITFYSSKALTKDITLQLLVIGG